MKSAKVMWLFTNRNCLVFDDKGNQIPEYQRAISCYKLDPAIARKATEEATEFHIACWREWGHEISKEQMQYLLGVRTEEDDLKQVIG